VPSLTAASVLYLQSGDCGSALPQPIAAGVWQHYAAVWHLQDNRDASAQGSAFVEEGTTIASVAAKIASGRQFDGADGALNAGSNDSLDNMFNDGGQISAWIKPNGLGGGNAGRILSKASATTPTDSGWTLAIDPNATGSVIFRLSFGSGIADWSAADDATPFGGWHLVVLQYRALPAQQQEPEFFVDGKSSSSSSGTSQRPSGTPDSDASSSLRIGNVEDGSRTFDGVIDEVRMSREMHTANWYATEYNNQIDPAGFYALSEPDEM
jgi:hypothetical protein